MIRYKIPALLILAAVLVAVPAMAQVSNGDFETGTTAGWNKWWASWSGSSAIATTATSEAAYTGSYGFKMECVQFTSGGVFQQVLVTPGVSYRLEGMWKSTYAGSSNWLEIILLDGGWNLAQADDPNLVEANIIAGYDGGFGNPAPATFDWEPFSATYANWPTGDGTKVASGNLMTVVLKLGGGGTTAYFDDVRLVQVVPEPSSLLALAGGVGLLGGLIRRRR